MFVAMSEQSVNVSSLILPLGSTNLAFKYITEDDN